MKYILWGIEMIPHQVTLQSWQQLDQLVHGLFCGECQPEEQKASLLILKQTLVRATTDCSNDQLVSQVHCKKVKLVDNKLYCLFKGPKKTKNYIVFDEYSYRAVRSSNGISEMRYFIKTKIKIENKSYPIQMSLTDRKQKRFKFLLGRKFLSKRFIVDVSQKFVISNS